MQVVCFRAFGEAERLHFRDVDVKELKRRVIRRFVNVLDSGVFIENAGFERHVVHESHLAIDGQYRAEVCGKGAEAHVRAGLQLFVHGLLAAGAEIHLVAVRKQELEHPRSYSLPRSVWRERR